jgi:hypothetical protein
MRIAAIILAIKTEQAIDFILIENPPRRTARIAIPIIIFRIASGHGFPFCGHGIVIGGIIIGTGHSGPFRGYGFVIDLFIFGFVGHVCSTEPAFP